MHLLISQIGVKLEVDLDCTESILSGLLQDFQTFSDNLDLSSSFNDIKLISDVFLHLKIPNEQF